MVESEHEHDMAIELEMKEKKRDLKKSTLLMTVLSAFFIYLGAKYTVESIIQLSEILSIGKEIIAASAVALGTSLPELIVSATAAREGKAELAIGNILGSNIFNSFTVMGVSSLFGTLLIPQSILTFALPIMLVATILYVFMTQDKQITQWEGGLLLIFYIFYIGKLVNFL
jgi:cation:H+ antiporter